MRGRYGTLDALRGIAALAVVCYHAAVVTDAGCTAPTCNVRFGYLAVDLFFALSGFVLSHAYDAQFAAGLSPWGFMRRRLVRLLPVYWLGLAAALPLAALAAHRGGQPGGALAGAALLNALVLPAPSGGEPAAAGAAFLVPLLRSGWSLFLELWVANLVWALCWRRLRGPVLAAVMLAAFGLLAASLAAHGSLDVGPTWGTAWGGVARVAFSFLAGVALRRWLAAREAAGRALPRVPAVAVLGTGALLLLAPVPPAGAGLFQLGCVALAFPLLIALGAGAESRWPRLGDLLGDASYPLYLIHIPLLDLWAKAMSRAGVAPGPVPAAAFAATALGLALAVDAWYDRPARRALARLLDRTPRPRRRARAVEWSLPAALPGGPAGG